MPTADTLVVVRTDGSNRTGVSAYHAHMIQSGDTIGPYTLLRTLGRGAFGEVWLADRRSSLLTTQVALKLPLDQDDDIEAIRREAQIWLRASGHTNIVPVLDAEIYNGQVVIASEHVAGGSLADWLEKHGGRAPSVDAAVAMIRGILAGLQHLHLSSLVHRDLKPGNILIQGNTPRLTDFGLTRVLQPSGDSTGIAGTPRYMAPEAFHGRYSQQSDVWAAGMLLHELLTGTLPYPETEFYALLLAITSDEPVVLSSEISTSLIQVLAKALEKAATDRFESAAEMTASLDEALSRGPSAHDTQHPAPGIRLDNFPVQLSSFIGRDEELATVKSLLGKTRLLTLTGTGGCGKTRLALQASADVAEGYADGTWLVELAPLADPCLVAQAVATALCLREETDKSLTQTLVSALESKALLLVVDNCEHVLDTVADLANTLLMRCPDLKILASSREGLGVNGEQTYRVPSLRVPYVPGSTDSLTAELACEFDSVRLFAARAALVKSDFAVTDANAASVARLCHRLDGLPLAIELAAARARSMPAEQIEARLHDRFRLLTGGSRTALPRQQTLRALIDWSYDLLCTAEQALLQRLSVFVGGWSLEAAEHVCTDAVPTADTVIEDRNSKVEGNDVLDLLTALVDKSLVIYEDQRGEARYRLLETVRQYARDKLVECGMGDAYRSRQRDYFLNFAVKAREQLEGPKQVQWLTSLETEHDNLRQALTFCLEDADGVERGLALGAALALFWRTRGYLNEGREHLAALLALPEAHQHPGVRARALTGAGVLARLQSDYAAARSLHEESLELRRELRDRHGISESLGNLAVVARHQGDYVAAESLNRESLAIRRELGDRQGVAASLSDLGLVASDLGNYPAARSLFEESLALCRELEHRQGIANSLINLGNVVQSQGDYAAAHSLQREALEIKRAFGDRHGVALSLNNLGIAAFCLGNYAAAQAYSQESLEIARELGDRKGVALSLNNLGELALVQHDYVVAGSLFEQSLNIRRELGDRTGIAAALLNLGAVARCQGDCKSARILHEESMRRFRELGETQNIAYVLESFACLNAEEHRSEQAILLWAAADRIREEIGSAMPPVSETEREIAMASVRQALSESALSAARDEGRAMTIEQAIETALGNFT